MILFYVFCFIVGIYYACVIFETFAEKYYRSPITTKREFYFALIPFFIWVKSFIQAFKDLD